MSTGRCPGGSRGTYVGGEGVIAMITKEEMLARRDDLFARREELMDRAAEIRERFQENVDEDTMTTAVGWALVSGGMAFGLTQWARGRRGIMGLFLPVGFLLVGVALLTNGFAHRRGRHIDEVEDGIRQQLSALDPIARYQVLSHVGRDTALFVRHADN